MKLSTGKTEHKYHNHPVEELHHVWFAITIMQIE
jgi:hypothetical protein